MDILLIDGSRRSPCELCGKEAELRPYGPGGKRVCFECAMKDKEEAERQLAKLWKDKDVVIIK